MVLFSAAGGIRMGPRADRIAVLILLFLVVLSWLPRSRGPIDLRWDAAVYYILGTSLAEGSGYRLLSEPGEIQATIYPPLLPAIVAGTQRALGTADPVVVGTCLRGLFFVLSVALVLATYRLLRAAARPSFALLGTFVSTLTFLGPWLSDRCYTDLPFALALVLFVRPPAAARAGAEAPAWCLATAAFLLRTIGVALLVAWVAEGVVRRRYRVALVRLTAALVPVIAWQLYVHHVQARSDDAPAYAYQRADYNIYNVTYGQQFSLRDHLNPEFGKASAGERALRPFRAIPSIVNGLGGAVSQPREQWEFAFEHLSRIPGVRHVARWRLITATTVLLGAIVLAGLLLQLARGEVLLPLSVFVYVAGLGLMPSSYYGELPRYLWVLSPLLMFSAFTAIDAVQRDGAALPRRAQVSGAIAVAALATSVLALSILATLRAYTTDLRPVVHRDWNGRRVEYRLFSYTDYHAFDRGLEWLKEHASPTDIVASTTPHWVYLRTGLKAVFPPFDRDPATASTLLDAVPVRYVVVADWLSRARAQPVVQGDPLRWQAAYVDGEFAIYQRSASRPRF